MAYESILVALTGKDNEENLVREAVRLSQSLDAELAAIHVNDPHAGEISMMMPSERLVTEEDIRNQFRKFGFEDVAEQVKVNIESGTAYAKIIARCSEGVDLLVLGHHQRHRFLGAIIDSIDEQVADLVICPILVVPCPV